MGLKHLKLRTATIEVSDGDILTVRGLGLVDIVALANNHREALSALFMKLDQGGMDSLMSDIPALVADAFANIPAVAMEIIALGADEDDVDLVNLLPLTAQLESIEQIANLTFASNSPKKVMETITRVMKGATAAIKRP